MENYIEDFSNVSLPDVELSEGEVEEIKSSVLKSITDLKRRNKNIEINVSNDEMMGIYKELGDKSDIDINGVKHGLVLRDVCLRAIEKDINISKNDIIKDIFICKGNSSISGAWMDAVIAHKIYLTKEILIVYGIDALFRIAYKKEIDIKDIESAGTKKTYGVMGDDTWVINIGSEPLEFFMGSEKTDKILNGLIEELVKLGVKRTENKFNWAMIVYIVLVLGLLAFIAVNTIKF